MPSAAKTNPETGTIYSRAQLKAAFELVENKANWKMPVKSTIFACGREVTEAAIIFYTGSVPKFVEVAGSNGLLLRVTARGYYAAIGA